MRTFHRVLRVAIATAFLSTPVIAEDLTGTADVDGYHLEVRDNGPGIAPEIRAHLFEPFFTTKPGEQGLGLGLTLSASLAAAAGGSLGVRHPDEGATAFVLTLPYPREPQA